MTLFGGTKSAAIPYTIYILVVALERKSCNTPTVVLVLLSGAMAKKQPRTISCQLNVLREQTQESITPDDTWRREENKHCSFDSGHYSYAVIIKT